MLSTSPPAALEIEVAVKEMLVVADAVIGALLVIIATTPP